MSRSNIRAARALRRYARIFPIGRPALHVLTGRYELACGARDRALRSFAHAEQEAERLGMRHEAAWAGAWHSKVLASATGRMKMESARQRLEAIGARWEAAQVVGWLRDG